MKSLWGIVLLSISYSLFSQEDEKIPNLNSNGYLSAIPSIYWDKDQNKWQSIIHNRLNFDWAPTVKLSGSIQFRNQLFAGNLLNIEGQKSGFKSENYYLPLTYIQNYNDNYLISLSIDRLWLQYTANKLEIKIGRQRINWGQTFIWSTNDIFNTYNFFEFDYPERPGIDAIRVQYYTSNVSSLDFASKIDSAGNISAAGLCRFNKWSYDFQIMTGYLQESTLHFQTDSTIKLQEVVNKDFTGGFGFAGSIKEFSLRGEFSYFYSFDKNISPNQLLMSFSSDYTFENQLNLMFEFFYADKINTSSGFNMMDLNSGNRSVKSQTFTKYNFFGQITYPINPIINSTLSGMFFYDDNINAFYTGPGVEISISDNIALSAFLQIFYFRYFKLLITDKEWKNLNYAFMRAKWNF